MRFQDSSLRPEDFVGRLSSGDYQTERQRIRRDIILQLLCALQFLVDRHGRSGPFIDMKIDVGTGQDFDPEDPLRNQEVIYTWIQGRGLEALAEHARWITDEADIDENLRGSLLAAIRKILPAVIAAMENARERGGGRLPFMMRPSGQALTVSAAGEVLAAEESGRSEWTLSDLFYAKGLAAAADVLGEAELLDAAEQNFAGIVAALRDGMFCSGQIGLDPKNPVQTIPGRFSHAGRMIGIGAATQFHRSTGQSRYEDLGVEFMAHILKHHVQSQPGRSGDFWEFLDSDQKPWSENGRIWSDPGHATEFAGLAFAHLGDGVDVPADVRSCLRAVLIQNFSNGFTGRGIVKAFDLRSRQPINSDMPWWGLPETMRAASLALGGAPEPERKPLEQIFLRSWSAFATHYLRPGCHLLAVPCLQEDGTEAAVIPATPDADPGYHTGLSLIACLPGLE